ncbi:hypothetical protein BX600DRAFT_523500 [Xylariales sp. PMI_506]|nr:hypothetical protein BX600DRAFT_523500 [Xylariales sp. PMI_506]
MSYRLITALCLGGCLWKQAYANMVDKRHENDNVLDYVVGVVFLGTPHIEDPSQLDFNIVESIVIPAEYAILSHNSTAKLFGIPRTHENICKIDTGEELFKAIDRLIESVLRQQQLSETFQDMHGKHLPLILEYSVTISRSIHGSKHGSKQDSKQIYKTPSASAGYSSHLSCEIIATTNNLELVKPKLTIPCFSVGSQTRKPTFFGREDILELIDKSLLYEQRSQDKNQGLIDSFKNLRTFALCGPGGIGKTELASEYIFTRKDKYSAIFWVTASSRNVLLEDFARIAVDLGLRDRNEAQDLAEACELVKGWLCNPVKSLESTLDSVDNEVSWLLVLDNVDDWGTIEDFWPTTGIGSILITSRDPLSRSHIYTAQRGLDLNPFSLAETLDFLRLEAQKPLKGTHSSATAVANWAGGLPLIITSIASTMANRDLTYDTMLELLKLHGFVAVSADINPGAQSGQAASIISMLGIAGLDKHTQSLLHTIAFLNSEGIPQQMLIDSSNRGQLQAFPKSHVELTIAQARLLQASLISFQESSKTLRMHRIYQDIVRQSLDPKMRKEVLLTTLELLSEAWVFQPLEHRFNTARYEACSLIFPHIDRLYQHYEEQFRLQEIDASIEAAHLFNDAGWYWFERGFPQESKPFFRLAQTIFETLQITEPSPKVAEMLRESHNNMGSAANETNDPEESLHHNLMWLQLMRQRKTSDNKELVDYELGCVYNEVGVAYAMNSMYTQALDFFKRSVSTYQSLPGYDPKWLGWPLPNIGLVHWILGDQKAALESLEQMRDIYADAYGPDDTQSFKTGKVLYGIGNVYLSLGNLDRALEYHSRALKQWTVSLGASHHRIGDVRHKLAQDLMGQGDFDKAQESLDEALRIFARRSYHKHEYARSIFRQGQLYLAKGEAEKAEQLFKEAHHQRRALVPHDSRTWDELLEKDYDELVIYWSR